MFFEIHKRSFGLFSREQLEKIKGASVAVFGIGGLGNFVSTHLVLTGVKELYIIDKDVVELSNLSRQFLYSLDDIGKEKVKVAKDELNRRSYNTEIIPIYGDVSEFNNWRRVDLIIDCLDNWESKKRLYNLVIRHRKPLIFASINKRKGFVGFSKNSVNKLLSYNKREKVSVYSPVVGIIASLESDLAIRYLVGDLEEEFLLFVDLNNYKIKKVLF